MNCKENLYIAPQNLYRIGNASSALMSRLRQFEIDTHEMNGFMVVTANGKGVSLYNKTGLEQSPLSGWGWVIPSGTAFPGGLKLIRNNQSEGHYTLAPERNRLYSEYVALLSIAKGIQKAEHGINQYEEHPSGNLGAELHSSLAGTSRPRRKTFKSN